jgi:hypothetical protein
MPRERDYPGDGLFRVDMDEPFEAPRYPGGFMQPKGAVLHVVFKGESRLISTSLDRGRQALRELDA